MKALLVIALIVAAFARAAIADVWRDNGAWEVRAPAGFGCEHRETLNPISEYARENDRDGFERALGEQMASGECTLLKGGTHVLLFENLPRDDLRRIRAIGDPRFLWLPFSSVHQTGTP